jgi:hypothetical protein
VLHEESRIIVFLMPLTSPAFKAKIAWTSSIPIAILISGCRYASGRHGGASDS